MSYDSGGMLQTSGKLLELSPFLQELNICILEPAVFIVSLYRVNSVISESFQLGTPTCINYPQTWSTKKLNHVQPLAVIYSWWVYLVKKSLWQVLPYVGDTVFALVVSLFLYFLSYFLNKNAIQNVLGRSNARTQLKAHMHQTAPFDACGPDSCVPRLFVWKLYPETTEKTKSDNM